MELNFDLVILSNGPGEITTWVLPVVKQIRSFSTINQEKLRISLILSPCPHATGNEVDLARKFPEIDRTQGAKDFFPFLLWGKTADNWSWYSHGLVLFLGGDQFFALMIAKRLGFSSLIYAEWEARWYRYIDYFAVMQQSVIDKIPIKFHHKCILVGDLMADLIITNNSLSANTNNIKIGLLPGSKPAKLTQGVPFLSAIASYLYQKNNQLEFIIPLAPTITAENLANYGKKKYNNLIAQLGDITTELIKINGQLFLETSTGVKIRLISEFPCYEEIAQCQLCLTTIGANTAQLGSLAMPMIVLIPTYQLTAMKSYDGIFGLLANLPIIGDIFATLINKLVIEYTLKKKKLYAWPNLWAKREIVPELIGELKVEEVGHLVLEWLENPDKLKQIKSDLQQLRGKAGASEKIAQMVARIISETQH